MILFITHRSEVSVAGGVFTSPHYWVGISAFVLVAFFGLLNVLLSKSKFRKNLSNVAKYKKYLLLFFGLVLFTWSYKIYSPIPQKSFWQLSDHWNYLDDYKAYQIIKSENLQNYNIADFVYYDTLATVIKYLLMKDGVPIENQDYYHNKFLFVLSKNNYDFTWITSYEYRNFAPNKILKVWKINDYYNLYLFQRLPQ